MVGDWEATSAPLTASVSVSRPWLPRVWFWLTGPALGLVIVVSSVQGMSQRYLTESHRPPDLLAIDLVLVSAACLCTRRRWPIPAMLVAAAVPVLLTWRGYYDGTTEGVVSVLLVSLAYRRLWWATLIGVVAAGASLQAQGSLDPTDHGGSFVVFAIGSVVYAIVAVGARFGHDLIASWLRRRRRAAPMPTPAHAHLGDPLGSPWVSDHRSALALVGVGLVLVSQLAILGATRTWWPVDPATDRFASTLCHDVDQWSSQIESTGMGLHTAESGAALAERRALQARTVRQFADQTGRLADEMQTLATDEPAGSATRETALGFASQFRSVSDRLRPLQASWAALPVDSLAHFEQAKEPLIDQLETITGAASMRLLSQPVNHPSTPSKRALARALHTVAGCHS